MFGELVIRRSFVSHDAMKSSDNVRDNVSGLCIPDGWGAAWRRRQNEIEAGAAHRRRGRV